MKSWEDSLATQCANEHWQKVSELNYSVEYGSQVFTLASE